jgi:hypothetical protein
VGSGVTTQRAQRVNMVDVIGLKKQIDAAQAVLSNLDKTANSDMASDTLNHVAFFTRLQLQAHIKKVFDNPIPRTVASPLVKQATPNNPQAKVFINDNINKGVSPAKYLRTEVTGAGRPDKRVERALKVAGVLGDAQQVRGVTVDKYGNMSGGKITQMLHAIGAAPGGYESKDKFKKSKWKVARRKADGKPFGIFNMQAGARLFMVFTKKQTYKERFKFFDVVQDSWNKKIKEAWAKAWARHVGKVIPKYRG